MITFKKNREDISSWIFSTATSLQAILLLGNKFLMV